MALMSAKVATKVRTTSQALAVLNAEASGGATREPSGRGTKEGENASMGVW